MSFFSKNQSVQGERKILSIRKKLVLIFTTCIVLLVALLSTIVGIRIHSENESNFHVQTSRELEHIGNGISIFFSDTLGTLDMLSQNADVRRADDSIHSYANESGTIRADSTVKSETEESLVRLFKNVFNAFPEYVEVYLGTKWGGYATCFDGEMSGGYDPRKRGWYELASSANGNAVITKAFLSTVGDVVVGLSKSVYDYRNSFIGNVSIEVTLNTLTQIISKSNIGQTGYVIMVQDDGVILADPKHSEYNFKNLNEVGNEDLAKLSNISSGRTEVVMDGKKWAAEVYTIDNPNWKLVAFMEDAEIFSSFKYTLRTMIIIGIILLVLFGFVTSAFAVRTLKPVQSILSLLKRLSEGDFTERLSVTSNDEFSVVAKQFNSTLDNVQGAMRSVNSNASMMNDIGGTLAKNMQETSISVSNINESLDDVKQQTTTQAASVTETTATMEQIIRTIKQLNESIESQAANVTKSSAAIEQILGKITSISEILEQNKNLIKGLYDKAQIGQEKVKDANSVVAQIAEQSQYMLEASTVIQNIAANTNLLAMNASIEAAHVGEKGQGFAVVAGEIRKLAQDSDTQGKRIAEVMQESTETIQKLTIVENNMAAVFGEVYNMAGTVLEKQTEIANAMREQTEGSNVVLSAIRDISNTSIEVKNGSAEMLRGSEAVAVEMTNLDKLTVSINEKVNEMVSGIVQINSVVQKVNEISQKNKESIENLSAEVAQFKV